MKAESIDDSSEGSKLYPPLLEAVLVLYDKDSSEVGGSESIVLVVSEANHYLLYESTIWDSCRVTYLVNNKSRLVPESIQKADNNDYVLTRTGSLKV